MISRNSDQSRSYFSRAGKASLSKFKILVDRDRILRGEKICQNLPKVKSQALLTEGQLSKIVSEELENMKSGNHEKQEVKKLQPSAAFLSPGRKEASFNDVPELGRYLVNYSLVEKTPIVYSMSKRKKTSEVQNFPDSFLSSNLHQFPDGKLKGIPFQYQTSRKDITLGMPSPHEERFISHNLIPSACSKYGTVTGPDLAKYAERKEFYRKKEFSPDYSPNKEFVLPKLAMDIKFKSMTERKSVCEEREWEKRFENNIATHGRKNFLKDFEKKKGKNKDFFNERNFSPSRFLNMNEEL
jgi:hypothetical protein